MSIPVTYNYVFLGGGSHTRQPGRGAGAGFTQLLPPASGGTFAPGDYYSVLTTSLLQTMTQSGTTYDFAFVNVSGGVAPETNNPSIDVSSAPSVTVGTSPIVVLVVYVATGGPNGHGPFGATIDAFDESLNTLVNDTFVTVTPDTDLTDNANVDGFVPTGNKETITALANIVPTAGILSPVVTAVFDRWVDLSSPASSPSGSGYVAGQNTSSIALAFYKTPPVHERTHCEIELDSYNALPDKVGAPRGILEQYLRALSACSGPQYAAAVAEIKRIFAGTQTPPGRP